MTHNEEKAGNKNCLWEQTDVGWTEKDSKDFKEL